VPPGRRSALAKALGCDGCRTCGEQFATILPPNSVTRPKGKGGLFVPTKPKSDTILECYRRADEARRMADAATHLRGNQDRHSVGAQRARVDHLRARLQREIS
jgi:hypothetical protein